MDYLDPNFPTGSGTARSPGFSLTRLRAPEPSRAVSQTSAARFLSARQGKEVEWKKKITPPPTAATRQGRRAAGREPAGHSRAYLWSAFSSLQSEALGGVTGLCCHTRPGPNTMRRKKHTFLLLRWARQPIAHTQTVYAASEEKGRPRSRNGEGSGRISRAVHRCSSRSHQLQRTHARTHNHGLKPEEGLMDQQ